MKFAGFVLSFALATTASASTIRELGVESVELAKVLGQCPAEYAQALQKGTVISKVTYLAPRTTDPKVRVEAWNLAVVADEAPPSAKVLAHFIVSRTTDYTGPLLPDQEPKVTFHCEFIAL
jgi:hypothetical protein